MDKIIKRIYVYFVEFIAERKPPSSLTLSLLALVCIF